MNLPSPQADCLSIKAIFWVVDCRFYQGFTELSRMGNTMRILGTTEFDQCVLNISLINLCNRESYVGQEIQKHFNQWSDETSQPIENPWTQLYEFTIYVPHPEQEYEGITLASGLTQGYNIEVRVVEQRNQLPYQIPMGGHFVVVMKQTGLDAGFQIAATGIFVRPLALLSLDIIIDMDAPEYQSVVVKHPIIRDYPSGWEQKLRQFLNQEISQEDLPNLVKYVDQTFNQDYRSPSWDEVRLSARGFAGV